MTAWLFVEPSFLSGGLRYQNSTIRPSSTIASQPAILFRYLDGIVMYDMPKLFQSIGIDAYYNKTWHTFYTKPGAFDIQHLTVFADDQAAVCFATMQCADRSRGDDYVELDFRLIIGLQKIDGQWTIIHVHHSIPSK